MINMEGDQFEARLSRNFPILQRGNALDQVNTMLESCILREDYEKLGKSTHATNINNTVLLFTHPVPKLETMEGMKGAGGWTRWQYSFDEINNCASTPTRNPTMPQQVHD